METVTPKVEAAFLALVNQYQGAIRRVCRTYAAASDDREEIFQEIIYQLWRSFPTYRSESAAMTWVYRVALNTAITAVRRQARRPVHVSFEPAHEPGSTGPALDEHASRSEWLYRAIRQLDAVDRALIMCYLDGMSYKRISEVLGLSESNVGTRLNRTRARLQEFARRLE
jgi:RNA polymerase sigma-70 factor, ECF subfamily